MTAIATRCGGRPSPTRSAGCSGRTDDRRRARAVGTPALLRALAGCGRSAQRGRARVAALVPPGQWAATTAGPVARDAGVSRAGRRAERLDSVRAVAVGVTGAAVHASLLDRLEHWRKPGVLCLTASSVPAPLDLAGRAAPRGARGAALADESRPYRPHLDARAQGRRASRDRRRSNRCPGGQTSITLVESRSRPRGLALRAARKLAARRRTMMALASEKLLIHRRFSACGTVARME